MTNKEIVSQKEKNPCKVIVIGSIDSVDFLRRLISYHYNSLKRNCLYYLANNIECAQHLYYLTFTKQFKLAMVSAI